MLMLSCTVKASDSMHAAWCRLSERVAKIRVTFANVVNLLRKLRMVLHMVYTCCMARW
jgi:hypothetical protein